MEVAKEKLVLASHNSDFLKDHISTLRRDYEVQVASTEEMVVFLAREWEPRFCIVDGDSPAFESIARLREKSNWTSLGVIVITRAKNLFKEERAFRAGADYFLSGPLEYKCLNWRMHSLLRRMAAAPHGSAPVITGDFTDTGPKTITFGSIRIFPRDYLIKLNEEVITATPTQFKLLLAFMTHQDQLLSRNWIRQSVWENANISPRSIDAQISKLKKLLPELDRYLVNIYGKGYILTVPKEQAA